MQLAIMPSDLRSIAARNAMSALQTGSDALQAGRGAMQHHETLNALANPVPEGAFADQRRGFQQQAGEAAGGQIAGALMGGGGTPIRGAGSLIGGLGGASAAGGAIGAAAGLGSLAVAARRGGAPARSIGNAAGEGVGRGFASRAAKAKAVDAADAVIPGAGAYAGGRPTDQAGSAASVGVKALAGVANPAFGMAVNLLMGGKKRGGAVGKVQELLS